MHLGSLTISRFRSCNNVTVRLRPDLTVLVDWNNGGKVQFSATTVCLSA